MAQEQEQITKAGMNNADLALDVLMTAQPKQLKGILDDQKCMAKIAIDERHVRVLTFRILRQNAEAIEKFNKVSVWLTFAILAMMVVQITVAIFK